MLNTRNLGQPFNTNASQLNPIAEIVSRKKSNLSEEDNQTIEQICGDDDDNNYLVYSNPKGKISMVNKPKRPPSNSIKPPVNNRHLSQVTGGIPQKPDFMNKNTYGTQQFKPELLADKNIFKTESIKNGSTKHESLE